MTITAAKLQAEVGGDTKGFDAAMKHADKTVAAAPGKWGKSLKLGAGLGLGLAGAVAVKGVMGAISAGVASLRQQGVVVAQTNAVIRSTGGAAHESAAGVRELSNAIEDKTAIDDKQVQAGANMLLTFTNIRNEVGKGNDIFDQSVSILADMSTAMGTDMKSGAIQLGKALNDPLKGITALTRVGVTFSDQQQQQIANFEKAGKTAEAQKVILAELNKEFGGSGAAFAASDAGQAAKFQDAIEGIQQAVATGLLPAVTRVRGQLDGFLRDPATIGQAQALGDAIAGIFTEGNLKTAASLMTTAAGAISTAIHLFSSLPPQVQALAVGAVALKKITGIGPLDIAKAAGGAVKFIFEKGSTPANPLFVSDVAGGLAGKAGAAAGGGGGGLGSIAKFTAALGLGAIAVDLFANNLVPLNDAIAQQTRDISANTTASFGTATLADLESELAGATQGLNDFNQTTQGLGPLQEVLYGSQKKALEESVLSIQKEIEARKKGTTTSLAGATRDEGDKGVPNLLGPLGTTARNTGAMVNGIRAMTTVQQGLRVDFRTNIQGLIHATKANDIQKFARGIAVDIAKGVGSVAHTQSTLKTLRVKLAETNDPATRRVLQAAIHRVEGKLPGREWVGRQLAASARIEHSNISTRDKLSAQLRIQHSLTAHGTSTAAHKLDAVIATERRILAKRHEVTVNVKPLSIPIKLDGRQIAAGLVRYRSIFARPA